MKPKSVKQTANAVTVKVLILFLLAHSSPAFAQKTPKTVSGSKTSASLKNPPGSPIKASKEKHIALSVSKADSKMRKETAVNPDLDHTIDRDKTPSSKGQQSSESTAISPSSSSAPPERKEFETIKHRLPQADEVSGSLIFSYPIVVPPGRNNLQPDVKLIYSNSNTEEGCLFGYSWSINIPYIERLNKKGTNQLYTQNDFYSSMSSELVDLGSGSFGSKVDNGEFYNYSLASNVWTVKDKNGTVYKFGNTAGSRQDNPSDSTKIYKWMLEEVRDTNDNYVKYTYYKESGQIYPSQIVYTGNGTTHGIFTVNFVRVSRGDVIKSYKTAFLVTTSYRISEINTNVSGSWVRKYTLGYTTGDNGSRAMLVSIAESGRDELGNITSLPAMQFTYQTATAGWDLDTTTYMSPEDMNEYRNILDLNGDSLVDIIKSYKNDQTITFKNTWLHNGSTSWDENAGLLAPILFRAYGVRGGAYGNIWDEGIRLGDINGDQIPDIVQRLDGAGTSTAYLGTGSSWTLNTNWVPLIGFDHNNYISSYGSHLIDLNGNGLPDIIKNNGDTTHGEQLDTGSGFAAITTNWTPQKFLTFPSNQLVDVNNDGLPDHLHAHCDNFGLQNKAYLNTGTGTWVEDSTFASPLPFVDICNNRDRGVRLVELNGDGLPDVIIDRLNGDTAYLNTGNGWVERSSWAIPVPAGEILDGEAHTSDIDGDGLIEFFYTTGNPMETRVWKHRGLEADLLSRITYPQGGFTDITYQKTTKYRDGSNNLLNPNMPWNLTTVKTVTDNDGSGLTSTITYSYEGGKYYYGGPFDRKLSGFSKIKKTDAAGNVTTTFYHQGDSSNSIQGEFSDEMWKIGKPYRIEVADISGSIYSKTINKWDSFDLGNNRKFVKLVQTLNMIYDGDANHKDKAESYTYDNTNGNQTQKLEWGEVTGSNDGTFTDTGTDEFTTDTSYVSNTGAYILGLPSQSTTINQSSSKVKESKFYYDTLALGSVNESNLTKREDWKTGATSISIQKTYDGIYGLVTQELDPKNNPTNYSYDIHNLYPVIITNTLNHTTQYQYDYSIGKPKQVTDPNNLVFQTVYDGLDRIIEERQPDISTPSNLVTKAAYAYTDTPNSVAVKRTDYLDAVNGVDTYRYYDGLDRLIQIRKQAEEANNFAVTDIVYNDFGLIHKESLPYFSTGSSRTFLTTDSNLYIAYSYDPMRRVTRTQNTVGTIINTYDDWKLTITDARGKLKNLHKDAYGNLVKVEEFNSSSTYTTTYEYNGLGSLTKITDANGNIRNFTYDGLNRRLSAQDLHAQADTTFGVWTFTYDDNGNLTSRTDPKNHMANYTYDDLSRILTEDFTGQAGIEVTYTYDTCANGIGRLCSVANSAATESRLYNALGQIVRETKVISSVIYQTDYAHDRLGNILTITNPDNSQVKYEYNSAGLLEKVRYKEASFFDFINLISDFDYSPLEKVSYQEHANGAKTINTYDATKLYRLSSKVTTLPAISGTTRIQDFSFTCDSNGNITQIIDNSTTNTKKTVAYTYDDLNRLTSATCTNAANGQNYTQSYFYDAIGNITSKSDQGTYLYNGHQSSSYANPHAVTSIANGTNTKTYTYDNNGNLTTEGSKTYLWDYNNRLVQASSAVGGGTPTTVNFYPAGGDGSIYHSSSSWDTAHDAASGSSANHIGSTLEVKTGKSGSTTYRLERAFLPFNTSSLPDNVSITDAKLKLYVAAKTNNDNDGDDWVTVVQASQPSTTSLSTADYALAGSINAPTEGVDTNERKDITNVTVGQYLTFTLNATGRGWINKTGFTRLGLREGHDVFDSAFTGSLGRYNQLQIRTSEYNGTSFDPSFEVTYTSGPPPITFAYDHSGSRVKYSNGSDITIYPSKNYNITGTSAVKHIFAEDVLVATVKGAGSTAQIYSIHTDHLLGSSVISNELPTVEEVTDYYPFGSIRLDEKAGSFSEQRKYTGYEFDNDTGLNYAGARYYNSTIGRFISQDPIYWALPDEYLTDPQQWNSYSYARNNPLNTIDPTGLYNTKTGQVEKGDTQDGIVEAINRSSLINTLSGAASLRTLAKSQV